MIYYFISRKLVEVHKISVGCMFEVKE